MTARHLIVLTLLLLPTSVAASPEVVVVAGDSYITWDTATRTWTIGNGQIHADFQIDRDRELRLVQLVNQATGRGWVPAAAPDTQTTIAGNVSSLGSPGAGYQLAGVQASTIGNSVHLAVTYDQRDAALRVVRHYTVWSAVPAIETWTRFEALSSRDVPVGDLNVWQLAVNGQQIEWINGLRGDAAGVVHDDAFSLRGRVLVAGDQIELGSHARSSEREVPYFKIAAAGEAIVGGLLWSGSWRLTLQGRGTSIGLWLGLDAMTTLVSVARPVETPHGFLALASRAEDSASALRAYVRDAVRGGRGFDALVTYNTWYAYGTNVDEAIIRREIDRAAEIGTELIVVDAGWYAGANTRDLNDFSAGLGNWRADESRFPSGLRALTDAAHARGLKFGLWVEPEHLALDMLNASGARESWLATSDGHYDASNSGRGAQLCLSGPAARAWLIGELERLIDEVRPDYLKWDNNSWINCNREGHGHGPSDGNYAHVSGLYDVLTTLRTRYPELAIENVSGGGNRMDFGMLRYTDVAWMDDRTSPSIHVRHNLEGLGTAMPPAYLFSFVIDNVNESLVGGDDVPLYIRSRMAGVLGLTFRSAELPETVASNIAEHVRLYKTLRHTIQEGSAMLLTGQASVENPPAWDAVQELDLAGRSVVFAFQVDPGTDRVTLLLRGLKPGATYDVQSIDAGPLGQAGGADLMTNGIEIHANPTSAAHMLIVTEQQP